MSRWERAMLYAVAVGLAVLLLFDGAEPAAGVPREGGRAGQSDSSEFETGGLPGDAAPGDRVLNALDDDADSIGRSQPLVITDDLGRSRIELRVGERGQPEIVLLSETGQAVLALRGVSGEGAEIVLQSGDSQALLRSESAGRLTFELQGGEGAHSRMTVSENGETELSSGRTGGSGAVLRTRGDGSAELALRAADGRRGPAMTLDASGEAAVELAGADGAPGPSMRLFSDGLGEISIEGPGSDSGPSMIRLPDGVAVMSVKLSNGQPGAAMVASPDGTSVVAATSKDGKQQAALRINAAGQAEVVYTEPPEQDRE